MVIILNSIIFYEIVVYEMEFLTIHVPKKGNAYLDGTVHVAKEVETIQRFLLEPTCGKRGTKQTVEPYMW